MPRTAKLPPNPPSIRTAPASVSAPQPAASPAPVAPAKAGVDVGTHGISINIDTSDKDATKADAGKGDDDEDADEPDAPGTITIKKNGKTVKMTGLRKDRDFDSVDEFMHHDPKMASMVMVVVGVVFLAPVLAIALILGYRMRKTRMLNETMLKLAERGVVAPAEALEAISSGTAIPPRGDAAAQPIGPTTLGDQVRDVRRRAAWSDLRKGVVMGAIGLAITLYSIRSPNVIGLVLLFVGMAYVVLWWFEERQIMPPTRANGGRSSTSGTRPGDAGSGGAA